VEIDEEGRVFLVEDIEGDNGNYKRMTFLMSVTSDGRVVYDGGRVRWVHPFPCEPGTGEIRGGKVNLPTRQLPQVVPPKASSDL
jgi:hypothetical protein